MALKLCEFGSIILAAVVAGMSFGPWAALKQIDEHV
jgi:hypothetical protein